MNQAPSWRAAKQGRGRELFMKALTLELLLVTLPPSSPQGGESTSLGEGG